MHIQLVGFEWITPAHTSVSDLCQHLHSKSGTEIKHTGYPRVLFTARTGGRFVGVFLTIKDQKSVTAIDVKSYRVSVQRLKAGTQLVDFNFFALNESTGKGLYSYYHNSAGVTAFNEFVERRFAELSDVLRSKECQGLGKNKADKAKRAAVTRKYAQGLQTRQMVRREQLPALLAKLRKISAFEFDASTLFANDSWFRPLAGEVAARRVKLRFNADASVGTLAERIVDTVTRQSIQTGRIEGEDEDKVRQIIYIIDTPDSFGHYDFNEVVKEGMIDYAHVEKSPFLGIIEQAITGSTAHFGAAA